MLHGLLNYTSNGFFCKDILALNISNQAFPSKREVHSLFLLVALEVYWGKQVT